MKIKQVIIMDNILKNFDVTCREVEDLRSNIDKTLTQLDEKNISSEGNIKRNKLYGNYSYIIGACIKGTGLDDTEYEIYSPDDHHNTFRFRIIGSNGSQDIDNIKSYDDIIELIDAIYSVNLPF